MGQIAPLLTGWTIGRLWPEATGNLRPFHGAHSPHVKSVETRRRPAFQRRCRLDRLVGRRWPLGEGGPEGWSKGQRPAGRRTMAWGNRSLRAETRSQIREMF